MLAKAVAGTSAIALIDSNGADGGRTYENTEIFAWDDREGWIAGSSSGHCGSGWSGGIAHACDEGTIGAKVVVEFRGERHVVEVQPSGYWLFAIASDDSEDYPRRVR